MPIVFANVGDPVGLGVVASLARPGGNATGFTLGIRLRREMAGAAQRDRTSREAGGSASGSYHRAGFERDPGYGAVVCGASVVGVRDASEIERSVTAFARSSNGGMIVTASTSALVHRNLITMLAARHGLPAVYAFRYMVTAGGLISYGPDPIDLFRLAAGYVDRILKGEKPADLPVQAPTRYELVINLKTAKALGIEIPATVLARADEVIE